MSSHYMTATEKRAVISLSSILALRMVGLFMALPIFSLYAKKLAGATPLLIGISIGIYGLSQALFQIPFGALSDRFGRKPIIAIGLLIFAIGSLIAALADSMLCMILGRALQGVGAIGSTILAMMSDLTREEHRTKAMAISGITIGISFSLAMLLGPILSQWMKVNELFYIAMFLGIVAIILLYTIVPTPQTLLWRRDTQPELHSFLTLLTSSELAKLNIGIFILHAIFTASFVAIPISLSQYGLTADHQWTFYLPSLLIAFVASLICIGLAERKKQIKPYFIIGIIALISSEILFCLKINYSLSIFLGLIFFFSGFSLLEAFMPSLISRTAPAARKGSALGIYSCSQFFGIFIGGVFGGWLYGQFNSLGVYIFCITLALFWLVIAFFMRPPRHFVTQIWRLSPLQYPLWESLVTKLQIIPGMVEVTMVAEDGLVYLKMEHNTTQHPDFIRFKEQLQSE